MRFYWRKKKFSWKFFYLKRKIFSFDLMNYFIKQNFFRVTSIFVKNIICISRLFMSVNDDYYREEDLPNDRFHAVYRCYSVAFLSDRERNNVENGGKILLPQSALEQLINQVNQSKNC
jgi:hypothetical protein